MKVVVASTSLTKSERIHQHYAKTTGCTYSLPENWNLYMVHIGDNDMHGAHAGKKRGHKHNRSQLELKALFGSIQGKYS